MQKKVVWGCRNDHIYLRLNFHRKNSSAIWTKRKTRRTLGSWLIDQKNWNFLGKEKTRNLGNYIFWREKRVYEFFRRQISWFYSKDLKRCYWSRQIRKLRVCGSLFNTKRWHYITIEYDLRGFQSRKRKHLAWAGTVERLDQKPVKRIVINSDRIIKRTWWKVQRS